MIELEKLTVKFGGVTALDHVSARFEKPVSGIIGPNGAGKTTTMNVISGFLRATGRVCVDGVDLGGLSPHRRTRWGLRRCFQQEQIADDLSVADNLQVLLDALPGTRTEKRADLDSALDVTGLSARADTPASELNTYERRLTDLARCLVGRPRLVVLDEPAGGLGPSETAHLGDLILSIAVLTGAQTLVIDHDVDLISRICEQTLVLDFGRRIACGETAAVLEDPKVRAAYLGIAEEGA
ncbi:ABC transporter ATP-binding protein [Allomesorhizobium camelthorni]|uniref:ABC transporter ATP-binding protein n=1 Tax=Allomesorhizobium camelthorni TaxID=475069 RepID=A0A6G4WNZ8_9HYPH|nr:ATP-binding cassette domain-containing protein [Mesorhizobium camelthorni]NGO55830.1 ABC transporter ATP-binding protein [Mesorhizobium camelthorni]